MKILITGATGLLGKEIGKRLNSEGHEITVLTRDLTNAKSSLPFPATFLAWENYAKPIPPSYFDGIDSVIHLAGESIASGRWTSKRKKLILESRVLGTRNIVAAIKASNKSVKQFISASGIGIYGDGDQEVNENSQSGTDFLADVCVQWENESKKLSEVGISVINPRIGIVLSKQGGAMEKMLPVFSLGIGGIIGDGKQWMSWIHQDDLTNMFVYFVNNQNLSGPYNAVSPNPLNNQDFSKTLAKVLGRGLFFPVPSFALKIALGDMSTLVIKGQKVSSKKLKDSGFKFKYDELESALDDLCSSKKECQQEIITEIWLPKKVDEVYPFFSNEMNLEKLTPKYLNFHVVRKSTPSIQEGTLIDYRLKLHGISIGWRTLIESWDPNKKFVDRQIKGPYKLWHHTHEFVEVSGGTLMKDRVLYKVPFGRLGQLISGPFVKADVEKIFSYRKKIISQLFY